MRIVGSTTRVLGGVFAGSSAIAFVVTATNSKGKTGERTVSSSNIRMRTWINPADGDRGLPAATGILVADAIVQMAERSSND